jgi:phosphoribosylglycinamide formyltransferase 2
VIDMTDGAALSALIALEKPDLVVPEIEAIATETLFALEEAGKITCIPTARAAMLTMNREGIRRLAAEELGLPTSPYRFAPSLDELKAACAEIGFPNVVKPVMSSSGKGQSKLDGPDDVEQACAAVGFPCVVKPVMSSSGKGQSKLDSALDVAAAWDYAASGSRVDAGRVIAEGFIDFDYEITLLTVRSIGASGEIETAFCEPIGHKQVQGDYVESWQPHPMSPAALERARDIAGKVTADLGGCGVFGVELFVKGDMVWFSEVSPRPHDTGMVTMASQLQSEFELHAKAVLGLPVDVSLRAPGASAVIYGQHEAAGIAFEGVADALRVPGVDLRLFGKPESFARRRMGVALATAEVVETARQRALEAAGKVRPVSGRA